MTVLKKVFKLFLTWMHNWEGGGLQEGVQTGEIRLSATRYRPVRVTQMLLPYIFALCLWNNKSKAFNMIIECPLD